MANRPSIVAIIAAFNEEDIIRLVVQDLLDQGVSVYLIDDQSQDTTVELVRPLLGQGVIGIETFRGSSKDASHFHWAEILERKARLAMELPGDWFIHHDADEFRSSPWPGVNLGEAIDHVDRLGYNAIDSERLDFWPTEGDPEPTGDPRASLLAYAPPEPYDRLQVRCWKRGSTPVDLVSSGGHEARFPNRRVFPIRFMLRHYPVRGQSHGARKVWRDRVPRFTAEERERGWHVQYDRLGLGASFSRPAAEMKTYDEHAVSIQLNLRHRGIEELEQRVADTESERHRSIEVLEHRLVQAKQEREGIDHERRVLSDELERSRRELAEARDRMKAQVVTIHGLETEVVDGIHRQAAVAADYDRARAELNDLRTAAAESEQIQSVLSNRLTELLSSRSWRWTASIRWIVGLWNR